MAEPVTIAVDVMGGDRGPAVVLRGALQALEADPDLRLTLVGPAEEVEPFAAVHDRATAQVATEVIEMGEHPAGAVRAKKDSSIVVGCRLVKEGAADGFFSAGSTGAVAAAGTAYVTPFKYEADGERRSIRPCLTSTLPNMAGGLTVFCDMGANPDVEPSDMVRFAQMGAAYASCVLGVGAPRVGLMANGTEDSKGSAFTKSCFPLMREQVGGFVGNCEGGDIVSGGYDVVVTDGFAGNVALKSIEGAAKFMMAELKSAFMGSVGGKVAALLLKKQMRELKAKLSGDAKGGAVLLGLRGVVVIGHGATSVEAVKNGALAAAEAVRADLVNRVADSMAGIVR